MKTIRSILALCIVAALPFYTASCSKEENEETGLLDGTWLITTDEWKGIVSFDKDQYRIEEYHDDRGYGLYTYKGNFYGTIKYWSESIDLFSSDSKGWLGENNYISGMIGKTWNMPSKVTDEMTITGNDGKTYLLRKTTGTVVQNSDIYGIWKLSSVEGKVYKYVNGQKGEYIEDIRMGGMVNRPSEIGFSQTTLKNTDGKNVYCVGSYDNDTYLGEMSLQGQSMQITGSGYSWFNNYAWNIVYVNESELKIAVEGSDGGTNPQYLEFNFVFRRVKTL